MTSVANYSIGDERGPQAQSRRSAKRVSGSVHPKRGTAHVEQVLVVVSRGRDNGVEVLTFVFRCISQNRNVARRRIQLEHREQLEAIEFLDACAQDDEVRQNLA